MKSNACFKQMEKKKTQWEKKTEFPFLLQQSLLLIPQHFESPLLPGR